MSLRFIRILIDALFVLALFPFMGFWALLGFVISPLGLVAMFFFFFFRAGDAGAAKLAARLRRAHAAYRSRGLSTCTQVRVNPWIEG